MRSSLLSAAPGVGPAGPTLAALLADARRQIARADAEVLLAHVLGVPRSALIAHDTESPAPEALRAFEALVRRRAAGEPVAYLRGVKEFWSLALEVNPAVLIPRPETELLVEWALALLAPSAAAQVADLGAGSGALAIAIARERPPARVTATDRSPDALAVARRNAQRHAPRVEFLEGSWWSPLAGRRFDLVVSNPPYVAEGDLHLADLRFEPALALTAGADGLAALRAIIGAAAEHLVPGGWLLLEHGADQGAAVRALLAQAGFASVETRRDLAGMDRASGGQWP